MSQIVLLTGVSGFVAQHICKLLLSEGYIVIGTVRSTEKKNLVANIFNSNNLLIEIVPDISLTNAFDNILNKHRGINFIIHTASPFFYETSNPEKDLIIPTINGVKNLINSIKSHKPPTLLKFVFTSSDAAIYSEAGELDSSLTFTEQDWNKPSYSAARTNPVLAYYYAKTMAEKWLWENVIGMPFGVTSINPSWIFGPQVDNNLDDVLNTSNETINQLFKNTNLEHVKGGFVDVRDVAKAHLQAITDSETNDQRLLLLSERFSTQTILDIINTNFPRLSNNFQVGISGSGAQDIASMSKIDNSKTKDLLDFKFVRLDRTVVDVVQQILTRR